MDQAEILRLNKLARQYLNVAVSHIDPNLIVSAELVRKIKGARVINEDAELPAFEEKKMKFGTFQNREYVSMMIDIRDSTRIINGVNGSTEMFIIFYVYAGVVASIVDKYSGTATEFLGDGVLSLFDIKDLSLDVALAHAAQAGWDILSARWYVLNPLFKEVGLPEIDFGIGIDHGPTIVTRFGYKGDTDLKAFGKCTYNASKLSKGMNTIRVSEHSMNVWPQAPGGKLGFHQPAMINGVTGSELFIMQ